MPRTAHVCGARSRQYGGFMAGSGYRMHIDALPAQRGRTRQAHSRQLAGSSLPPLVVTRQVRHR